MLVKLDSIAPSFTGEVLNGVTMYKRASFVGGGKEAPNDLRLFRLLPFIIVFQTGLFVVFVWELPVAQYLQKKANVTCVSKTLRVYESS